MLRKREDAIWIGRDLLFCELVTICFGIFDCDNLNSCAVYDLQFPKTFVIAFMAGSLAWGSISS